MTAVVTNKSNKHIFKINTIPVKDWKKKDHGQLFQAQRPIADPSRNFYPEKGQVCAGDEEFFFKYGIDFDIISRPPAPQYTNTSGEVIDVTIMIIKSSMDNCYEEELMSLNRTKDELLSARSDMYGMVKQNDMLTAKVTSLEDSLAAMERLIEEKLGTMNGGKKKRK